MEPWWKTWGEINRDIKGRKVVFYGRSEDWTPKTLPRIQVEPAYIVDRSPTFVNTTYLGYPVELPEKLFQENRDEIFIVITADSYEGIVALLLENGFKAGLHFACCPEYKDWCLLEEVRSYEQKVIVSCSDHNDKLKVRYSRAGGGIYRYHIGPNTITLLQKGAFRQIIQAGELIFAIEYVERKIYIFDLDFKVLEVKPLTNANDCGLAYNKKRNVFFIANAGEDTISVYEANNFKLVDKIYYSKKSKNHVMGRHHLNDVCVSEDFLFVSYFSHSGNWKREVYDGGISEYQIDHLNDPPMQIVGGLWKPHSPEIIQGNLCYLDSMRGRLHLNSQMFAGEFSGFTRGLAHDGRFYYVGQSEDMYVTKRFGIAGNIMMNAGFYLFDITTRASRFYPMLDNMNIHDLLIVEK
jgi:hypothetical protein